MKGMQSQTPGELYVNAMAATQRYMDGVQADQWHAPTPNTEWDVKQVANHIIGENLWAGELLHGKNIAEVGNKFDGDVAGSDPAASYRASVSVATDAVTAPGAMEAVCHLSFGDFSGADYSAQLFLDLLIHGSDIAKATEQDTRLPPELVEACIPIAQEITAMARSSGVYGNDLPVSPDADQQTRLLALVGRHA
jgi:uncharacterized protein (TIGR03086 family)